MIAQEGAFMNVQDVLKRIEDEIKQIGITKEEFYAASNITSATFSNWNTGKFNPTAKKLRSAANALGITYEYLLTGKGQKNKPDPVDGVELTDTQKEAMEFVLSLSDEQLRQFIRIGKAMKEE